MPTLTGFHPYKGVFVPVPYSIKASQVLIPGAPLVADNAGTAGELTIAATDGFVVGVYCDKVIATTDADYASIKSNRNVWPVQHDGMQLWKCRVSTGTAAHATESWDYGDLATGGLSLTLTDTNKDFRITKVLDGTASNGVVVGYFASYTTEPSA
jgi:hypothetical protein